MHPYLSRPLLMLGRGNHGSGEPSLKRRKRSRVEVDFQRLLDRVACRLYPETIPVLASYWLKTVYWNGYARDEWRELDKLLRKQLQSPATLPDAWRQAAIDIRNWIKDSSHLTRKAPASEKVTSIVRRPALGSDALAAYAVRLLNEWLPQELARLLIREPEPGVPALTVGQALERLLLRDRLSISTLEGLLDPQLLSPRLAYPADLEMLRDVVLFLLGRTEAPRPAVLPAAWLTATPDSRLPAGHGEEVAKGYVVAGPEGEELHVPIRPDSVAPVLAEPLARIGSVVVTADGRCWQAERLEEGARNVIVYRPHSRLSVDYSRDHLRVRVPWPDQRRSWTGAVGLPQDLEMFGRRWRVAAWERDPDGAWVNLVFSEALNAAAAASPGAARLRRSAPASADLAWAELGSALGASIARGQWDPIESLQREDLIPLGRALFGLAQSIRNRELRTEDAFETHLNRIQFLQAGLEPVYGVTPWRILPSPLRNSLLRKTREYPGLRASLAQTFADLPPMAGAPASLLSLARFAGQSGTVDPFDRYKSA